MAQVFAISTYYYRFIIFRNAIIFIQAIILNRTVGIIKIPLFLLFRILTLGGAQ